MLQQVLAAVLPLILWGAVSGVLNLMLTRKSQIEAWVSAHPTLAAWSKFLRSVGFDPWALHAWATLLVKKKLPEAQQADSAVARIEQRKADMKRLGVDKDDPPGDSPAVGAAPISIRPPGGMDAELRAWRPAWLLGPAALAAFGLVAIVVVVSGCSGVPKNPQHPDPACSDENYSKLLGDCAADAATCVVKGGPEETCGAICDGKADAWKERCQ